jgi:hypothetical protein
MIEQHAAESVRGARIGIGRRCVAELREAFAVPRTDGSVAQRGVDQAPFAIGETQRVDTFGIDIRKGISRQRPALWRDVVESRGSKHAIAFERTQQAFDREVRQPCIGTNEYQRLARKRARGERKDFERIVAGWRFNVRRAGTARGCRTEPSGCLAIAGHAGGRRRRTEHANAKWLLANAAHG